MNTYILRISTRNVGPDAISRVMAESAATTKNGIWEYRIVERATEPHVDFVSLFVDMFKRHEAELRSIGVKRESVTVWMLYEYDEQCNMEFSAADLKKLGDAGLKLCVSCWQKQSDGIIQ